MESREKYLELAEARHQVMAARAERARHIGATIVRVIRWMAEHGKRLAAGVKFNA